MNTYYSDEIPELKFKKIRQRHFWNNSSFTGLLLISPWIIGFVLLKLIPILAALGFSFTNFYMLAPEKTKFIGLENYINILHDQMAGASLFGSLGEFFFIVPIELITALLLAVIFSSSRLKNRGLLRTLFFLPSIIPAVTIYIILDGLTNPRLGWVNQLILTPLNLPSPNMYSLFPIILSLWSIGPGFLIMFGAIQSVSKEIYEAARVDGAGPVMRLFAITIPVISPAIFFSLVINMTNAFGGVVLLDRGLPFNQSVSPMESYIASQMFSNSQLGYASALAWVMFLVVMVMVLMLFRSARYWVYFPEEEDNAEF